MKMSIEQYLYYSIYRHIYVIITDTEAMEYSVWREEKSGYDSVHGYDGVTGALASGFMMVQYILAVSVDEWFSSL